MCKPLQEVLDLLDDVLGILRGREYAARQRGDIGAVAELRQAIFKLEIVAEYLRLICNENLLELARERARKYMEERFPVWKPR